MGKKGKNPSGEQQRRIPLQDGLKKRCHVTRRHKGGVRGQDPGLRTGSRHIQVQWTLRDGKSQRLRGGSRVSKM